MNRLLSLKILEWDRFNMKTFDESFNAHENVINQFKEFMPLSNQIFETFLKEIINLGKILEKNTEVYEDHFYENLPKWYDLESKHCHAI